MLSHPQADYNVSMDRDRSFKTETVSGTVLIMNESQHVERYNQEPSKFPPAYRLTYKRNFWALHTYNHSCKLWSSSRTCGHIHCNYQSSYLVLLGQIPTKTAKQGNYSPGSWCSSAAMHMGTEETKGAQELCYASLPCFYRKLLVSLRLKAKFSFSL